MVECAYRHNSNMSVDVMYQPYAPYFPYHHHQLSASAEHFKKFSASRVPDPLEGTSSLSSLASVGSGTPKQEYEKNAEEPLNTVYLSSNCVLMTYFSGDIATNVDEHFTRALSNPSSFSPENPGSKPPSYKDTSSRSFAGAFWGSSYHTGSALPGASTDPYMAGMTSSLHHASVSGLQDPWRYPLSTGTHSYTHPSVHDLAYPSMATSSRFNPHYGSLLPSSRLAAAATGQSDLNKHTDTWTSRYHSDTLSSSLASHTESSPFYSGLMDKWF